MWLDVRSSLRIQWPTLPCCVQDWNRKDAAAAGALQLPSFSLSPLSYITQIGEHLLTLPQHLEPYASEASDVNASTSSSSSSSSTDNNGNITQSTIDDLYASALPDEGTGADDEQESSGAEGFVFQV
jgi:hypothetical protein